MSGSGIHLRVRVGFHLSGSGYSPSGFGYPTSPLFEGHASNVLTETDVAVEKLFRESISALFSDHKFIGEENEGTAGEKIETYSNNPTWIIDPIDGTMNFVHGNPVVCTSVGLAINRRIGKKKCLKNIGLVHAKYWPVTDPIIIL